MLWVVDIIATHLQWRLWRMLPDNTAARSRLTTGLLLTVGASVVAAVALLHLFRVDLTHDETNLLMLGAFIVISIPQAHWLWEWWRGF